MYLSPSSWPYVSFAFFRSFKSIPEKVNAVYELVWEGKDSNSKDVSWTRYAQYVDKKIINADVLGTKLTVKILFTDENHKEILSNFSKQEETTCECDKALEVRVLDHETNSSVWVRNKPNPSSESDIRLERKKAKILVLDDFKKYSEKTTNTFYHVEYVNAAKETKTGYIFTSWIQK